MPHPVLSGRVYPETGDAKHESQADSKGARQTGLTVHQQQYFVGNQADIDADQQASHLCQLKPAGQDEVPVQEQDSRCRYCQGKLADQESPDSKLQEEREQRVEFVICPQTEQLEGEHGVQNREEEEDCHRKECLLSGPVHVVVRPHVGCPPHAPAASEQGVARECRRCLPAALRNCVSAFGRCHLGQGRNIPFNREISREEAYLRMQDYRFGFKWAVRVLHKVGKRVRLPAY